MKALKIFIRLFSITTLLLLPLSLSNCGRTKIVLIPESRAPVPLPDELAEKYGQWGVSDTWMKERIEYELQQKLKRQQDSIALLKCGK